MAMACAYATRSMRSLVMNTGVFGRSFESRGTFEILFEPGSRRHSKEELAPVSARPGIGHGEFSGFRMLQRRMKFVCKFVARSAHAAAVGTTALNHELGNHAMEDQPVVESTFFLLAGLFIREFFRAFGKPDEICDRLRRLFFEQAHHNVSV
jgi:hypothetical protein